VLYQTELRPPCGERVSSAPGRTRTPNLRIRSPLPPGYLPGVLRVFRVCVSRMCHVRSSPHPWVAVNPWHILGYIKRVSCTRQRVRFGVRYATAHPEKTRRERHLRSSRPARRSTRDETSPCWSVQPWRGRSKCPAIAWSKYCQKPLGDINDLYWVLPVGTGCSVYGQSA
jgi:hypothetical protein